MATASNTGQDFSFPASGNLSTKQYYFVSLNSSSQIQVAGANVSCLGVLQDKPKAANDGGQVRCFGITKVLAGGVITVNDKVASDSSGKAVKATAGSVSAGTPEPLAGSYVQGIALSTVTTGDYVSVLLTHAGITN